MAETLAGTLPDRTRGPARQTLIETYGEAGRKVVFGETFEQSPYSRSLSLDEFRRFMTT